ncbi:MAG: disulfide bond formation protein B [Tepidimonas sp.]|uniref:disulfide bond formation protein B n=1 Tax=Tepidimonas sp. TaxID=2002775 RepID=UPI00259D5342|nr:disulfide bond formation protein B [Tepidimonas sp.]MDM7456110.1 disulfide bond formation protein B [Tepidimonas sp.]
MAMSPRAVLGGLALWCLGLLGFGLYLQHVVGLEPCPMCIVQRYALILVALATAGAAAAGRRLRRALAWLALVLALAGAAVAARQSWLQWYPPEILACGRDLFGMIESFPLKRAIPMIFRGSGDCTAVDWTFLGLTIANWSFLNFGAIAATLLGWLWSSRGR